MQITTNIGVVLSKEVSQIRQRLRPIRTAMHHDQDQDQDFSVPVLKNVWVYKSPQNPDDSILVNWTIKSRRTQADAKCISSKKWYNHWRL